MDFYSELDTAMKLFVWLILMFKYSFYKIAGVIVGLISV